MSISDNYEPVKLLGDGVTNEFSANWSLLSSSYIRVYLENVSTGSQTLQTLDSDYSLSFDDDGLIVDFSISSPPSSSFYVVISRSVSQEQTAPYSTSNGFQGQSIETSLDKITAMIQDVQDDVDRSAKTPVGSNPLSFPAYSAGLNIGWSSGIPGTLANATKTIDEVDAAVDAVAALTAQSGVKVSSNDAAVGFLDGKLIFGSNISSVINNEGANESITISVADASTTTKGVVESATLTELRNGTSGVTPPASVVKSFVDEKILGAKGWSFTSAAQTITAGGTLTIAHGLGYEPTKFGWYIECTTDEGGFTAGEKAYRFADYSSTANEISGFVLQADDTNIYLRFGTRSTWPIVDWSDGTLHNATFANWE